MKRESIRLLVLADLHYNNHGRRWENEGGDGPVFMGPMLMKSFEAVLNERAAAADHVIIAGDMTNNGLDHEYGPIEDVLKRFGDDELSMIPGNHDMSPNVLSNLRRIKFQERFQRYFGRFVQVASDESVAAGAERYPYLKSAGSDVAVIGLDTTADVLTRFRHSFMWFSSSVGCVGYAQMMELKRIVSGDGLADKWIVILMHHDPFVRQNPWTKLGDLKSFRKLIDELSLNRKLIVVCGHDHRGVVELVGENVLHLQPPSFCGRRTAGKGRFLDIVINEDLSYNLLGR